MKELSDFTEAQRANIDRYGLSISYSYFYTAKIFSAFNEKLNIRKRVSILKPGVQIAANGMPQGSVTQIPLTSNIGRQNQMHVVCSLANARSDLGRKGFQEEILSIANIASRAIINNMRAYKPSLRVNTGVAPTLKQKLKVDEWKKEFEKHEKNNPLVLTSKAFFAPKNSISILSIPTREQDVIALFNQILAGGVIRGIEIMSTNERFIYDSMFRAVFSDSKKLYVYHKKKNPLGVDEQMYDGELKTEPKILEYKYNLDALFEDLNNGNKNTNEIDLVVAWEAGRDFKQGYKVTSLLIDDNLSLRSYHGITHTATNIVSGQHEFDLILLKDLISFLQDQTTEKTRQVEFYGDQ